MKDWLTQTIEAPRYGILLLAWLGFLSGWLLGRIVMAEKLKDMIRDDLFRRRPKS